MKRFFYTLFFLILVSPSFAQIDSVANTENELVPLPVFSMDAGELDGMGSGQDVSGLLQSSRDIFASTAGYTFGAARYRLRGYDTENTFVLINGIEVNDMQSGRPYWGTWGGLNDVLRNQEIDIGISASKFTFGGIGGLTNIETRASSYSKGVKGVYSLANRSYRNRLMLTASTGMMENGWAFTVSGSRRWAKEGYVEGTFYDAWSYFLAAEKKINSNHSIGFIAFGAPNKRGRSGVAIQEAYDLTGYNYYNPNWGLQNGEKRNARVNNYHQPMFMLTHYWDVDKKTDITSTISYAFGRGGSSALNWVETSDPRPDYYRNFPSWYASEGDFETANAVADQWQNNPEYSQLNWDAFYFANSKYLYTVKDADGIEGNYVQGKRSKFIVEDRRYDKKQLDVNINANSVTNEHLTLSGGLDVTIHKGDNYNVINDLLGGEYWLDIDKYASQEPFFITDEAQSDLNHPNRIVKEGDVFGHSYTANVNYYGLFGEAYFTYSKFEYYVAASVSHTTFWRTGHMRTGLYPDDSYGDSEKQNFNNYGIKAGVTYKLNGRNYFTANGLYQTRAPFFRNSYISPRTRDFVVNPLNNEKILSGDINYLLRTPIVKARLTLYATQIKDQTWARSFYHDDLNTFVNYLMTGVDKFYAGMELGVEVNITSELSASGVFGTGDFIYNSRPDATVTRDNDQEMLSNRTVYFKGYNIGGRPATVGSLGLRYNGTKYWWVGVSGNYWGDMWLDPNPDRRTEEALAGFSADDMRVEEVLAQEKLDDAFTMDVWAGKSFKWGVYYLSLNVSVSNVLNTTDFASGGFEQLRYDPSDINKFPPKYFYLYGRTYFINISFRF